MKASITEGSKFLEHGEFYEFGSQGKFRLKHTNSAKVPLLVIPPVTHSRFRSSRELMVERTCKGGFAF